jgi:hypothetical protein
MTKYLLVPGIFLFPGRDYLAARRNFLLFSENIHGAISKSWQLARGEAERVINVLTGLEWTSVT